MYLWRQYTNCTASVGSNQWTIYNMNYYVSALIQDSILVLSICQTIPLCPNNLKTLITPYWGCTVCVLMSQW